MNASYAGRVRGLTQHAVSLSADVGAAADALGVSHPWLSIFLRGDVGANRRLVEGLERAFGCRVDDAFTPSGRLKPDLRLLPANGADERALETLEAVNRAASEAFRLPCSAIFSEADAQDGGGFEAHLATGRGTLVVGSGRTRAEALLHLADELARDLDNEATRISKAAADLRRAVGL